MCIIIGQTIDARLEVDERETTQLVLEIVNVAEKNGLKLPREFGLILKQVLYYPSR
jgi:aarF domain-containing kinase